MPDIESSYSRGIEKAETSIVYSRYAWDCETEAVSSTSHHIDEEGQRYGGIYIGETYTNSHNATNIKEIKVSCSRKDVNIIPNQVNIEKEDDIHIIESNVLSEDNTVSLHSNCKIESRKNSNLINSTIQNNSMNVDENKIEILETIDDEATNSPSQNIIFPSEPEDNKSNKTEVYSDSREHKSILKCVIMTSLLVCLLILSIIFIRTFKAFDFSTIINIIIFMVTTIFIKLCRTFLVIFSSIYCFELIRSLFSTITYEIVEFFQLSFDRFITYF